MSLIMEVLYEVRGAAVVVEGTFVFVIADIESSSSLAHIGFVAIRAG
jgi:hypothetical protein